jgi:serine/threonine protein phosphatase PrpC
LEHPSLLSLQIEDYGIEAEALPLLQTIIITTRRLRILRVGPISAPPDEFAPIIAAVPQNRTLVDFSINRGIESVIHATLVRNLAVSEITAAVLQGYVPRSYLTKAKAIKSIRLSVRENSFIERRSSIVGGEDKIRFGMSETIGRRSEMCGMSIALRETPVTGASLFGGFDGHGGRSAVEYASANLPSEIRAQINCGKGFAEAFEVVHGKMAESCTFSGTTAAVAVVHENRLAVAAVGDTRCVLAKSGKAVQLTIDHRPDIESEAAHIMSKGGRIEDGRVNGVLEISRTLGDSVLGECVRATPDVRELDIEEDDQFLILACDGVWSVMTNQDAVDLIVTEEDPIMAARNIRDKAFERESTDNISVIVVSLSRKEGSG